MNTGMRYGECRWIPLSRCDLREVVEALDHMELRQWIASEHSATFFEAMTKRLASEMEGKSLTFVIRKGGRIVGITGLSDYPGLFGTLQTSTYIHPDCWGTGLNALCKSFIWAIAHELLGHESIVASIDMRNERSQRALRKSWPGAYQGTVHEFWRPRDAALFEIRHQPKEYVPLTAQEQRSARRALARTTAWQRWKRRKPGDAAKVRFTPINHIHMETLYGAVAESLIARAEQVETIAEQVADQTSEYRMAALLDQATEVIQAAQHTAIEHMVELAEEGADLSENAQAVVVEAIIELRDMEGIETNEACVEEITSAVADPEGELHSYIEPS